MRSPYNDCVKRRAIKLVLFLLAGVIINIAVAWGCIIFVAPFPIPFGESLASDHDREHLIALGWEPKGGSRTDLRQTVGQTFGLTCRMIREMSKPGQSRLAVDASREFHAGFPMRSMFGEQLSIGEFGRSTWIFVSGRPAPEWRSDLEQPRTLPFTPIWPGFAINTIFYAAVLWVLSAVPGKVRRWRRIKRGQCASCGYSLRGTPEIEKCPECGAIA